MQRVSGGYTIVELIIVLGVSISLLAIAMTFLAGSEDHTRFSASMRDVQSQMQDWINDVPTGFAGAASGKTGLTSISCTASGGVLQIDNSGSNATPDCIFLGKVIQVTTSSNPDYNDNSNIYAYSVFGQRTTTDQSTGDQRLVGDLVEAHPTPAVGLPASGNTDLTESYTLEGGARVKSVNSEAIDSSTGAPDPNNTQSHMAGFFLSFNQLSANVNGSEDLKSYLYNMQSNQPPATSLSSNIAYSCISISDLNSDCRLPSSVSPTDWPESMQDWSICFDNPDNSDTAVLTVSSSAGLGASTQLEFKAC